MVSFPFTVVRDLTIKVKSNNKISDNQEKGV
jgi:hypothetical protein